MKQTEQQDKISIQQVKQTPSKYYIRKKHPPSNKKVKVNTSHCRGELRLIKNIIKERNWVQVFKGGDIMWSGLAIPQDQAFISTELFVNRLPGMPYLCHKKTLGFILNKFRQYWPDQFWFYPVTYLLPEDSQKLQKKLKNGKVFIAKPSAGCQGDGIVLIRKMSEIPKIGQEWIVQPYIDKPLLLNKKKFDFRLYVLISSVNPYICYLNQEGLARFCTEDYQPPTKQNFNNPFIHLTNYSLNKNHPDFQNFNEVFGKGGKRCLKVVWQELEANGVDVQTLRSRIEELTQRFLTGIYPFLKYYYRSAFPKNNGKCFHVIGIDILVDEELNPWLLQSNNNPSFNIEHQATIGTQTKKQLSLVDQYIKQMVVEDALYLARKSINKQRQMAVGDYYYSFKKILDVQSEQMQQMNLIENMLKIFHSYCGIRSKQMLTPSQFAKLSNLAGMTNEKITKNDYHLFFIKIMRQKFNHNQMTFQDFIDALEYIILKLRQYTQDNKLEVIQQHIQSLIAQLPQIE